jgi:hypothetical protein
MFDAGKSLLYRSPCIGWDVDEKERWLAEMKRELNRLRIISERAISGPLSREAAKKNLLKKQTEEYAEARGRMDAVSQNLSELEAKKPNGLIRILRLPEARAWFEEKARLSGEAAIAQRDVEITLGVLEDREEWLLGDDGNLELTAAIERSRSEFLACEERSRDVRNRIREIESHIKLFDVQAKLLLGYVDPSATESDFIQDSRIR